MTDSCENSYKLSGSIKRGEFLYWLINYCLLGEKYVPRIFI